LQCEIDSTNNQIRIFWQSDTNSVEHIIYKKKSGDTVFTEFMRTGSSINEFRDIIIPGEPTEYKVERDSWNYWAYGYIYCGRNIAAVHQRGSVLLLIDEQIFEHIQNEIIRYVNDLRGDGWNPFVVLVPRAEYFDKNKVSTVKSIIDLSLKQIKDLKSAVLIGRVPVPYSGNFAIDGHSPEHDGAWPSDIYYSVIDGKWTDTLYNTNSNDSRLVNIPGDGKFDQTIIPAPAEIEIGRIDMYNLISFNESEIELLKHYFNKNHQFRNKIISVPDSFAVIDRFGLDYREAFSSNGWMNFSVIGGLANVTDDHFRFTARDKKYLMVYGCGPGSYASVHDCAYTDEYASEPFNSAFALLFGSFNGDWDSKDNVLRAVLASKPFGLASMWAGRPYWFLHHLALGKHLGYSTLLSQNSSPYEYSSASPYARRHNHIALLGDPTLRLHYNYPVKNVIAEEVQKKVNITWDYDESDSADIGFYVYRFSDYLSQGQLLNEIPIKDKNFIDINPPFGVLNYMVKSVKSQYTASGDYVNLSTGKFSNSIIVDKLNESEHFRIFPNPVTTEMLIVMSDEYSKFTLIKIYDINGKLVHKLENNNNSRILTIPISSISNELSSGLYFIEIGDSLQNFTIIRN